MGSEECLSKMEAFISVILTMVRPRVMVSSSLKMDLTTEVTSTAMWPRQRVEFTRIGRYTTKEASGITNLTGNALREEKTIGLKAHISMA